MRVLTTARTTPVELSAADLFVAADVATAEGCALLPLMLEQGAGEIIHITSALASPGCPIPKAI